MSLVMFNVAPDTRHIVTRSAVRVLIAAPLIARLRPGRSTVTRDGRGSRARELIVVLERVIIHVDSP